MISTEIAWCSTLRFWVSVPLAVIPVMSTWYQDVHSLFACKRAQPGERGCHSSQAALALVLPSTNAVSERTFSAMRRLKTYLRTTMKQDRLNHLLLLHVHKDRTDGLPCTAMAKSFVGDSEHRLTVFGHVDSWATCLSSLFFFFFLKKYTILPQPQWHFLFMPVDHFSLSLSLPLSPLFLLFISVLHHHCWNLAFFAFKHKDTHFISRHMPICDHILLGQRKSSEK